MFRIGALLLLLEEDNVYNRIVRRHLRDESNPLELPDTLFIQHYRVSKADFTHILEVLDKNIPPKKKSFGVTPIIKLGACIRFFAEGGYQKGVARDYQVGMVQSTFCEMPSQVLEVLEQHLCGKWITYPTEEETRETAQDFYRKFGIPGVVGCIDGTHINIVAPKENKHLYYNRKGNYSLNTTLICDSKKRIRFVDATHPGANHDSFVQNTSRYNSLMEQNYIQKRHRVWLLGDGGYPLQSWLLTPHRTPTAGSFEQKFNDVHAKCRNIIERTNGVRKGRWRCLLGVRDLLYEPKKKAVKIVNVCVALHNICISYKFEQENEIQQVSEDSEFTEVNFTTSVDRDRYLSIAQNIRTNIADSL